MIPRLLTSVLACCGVLPCTTAQAESPQISPLAQQVLDVTQQWVIAEDKHDAAALERILDDKFISTFEANKPIDKDAFIKGLTTGQADPARSQTLTDQSVIVDGDTAVTLGTDTFHGANEPPLALRYTITYIHRGGDWRALAEQIVAIPNK